MLKYYATIDMVHIPYKGSGSMMPDLISGQISAAFPNRFTGMPLVNCRQLRAFGVTTKQRSAAAPGTPLIAEAIVPEYDMST